MGKLQDRIRLFAREYVKDLNATRAAVSAGYSKKTAYAKGHELLKKVEVKTEIQKLLARREAKLDYSADRILEELTKLGFSNMLDYLKPQMTCSGCGCPLHQGNTHGDGTPICPNAVPETSELTLDFSQLTREQAAAIQEYTVDATGGTGDGERKQVMRTRFKLADKTRALELLGKYRKLFTEKIEVTGLEGLAELLRQRRKSASA